MRPSFCHYISFSTCACLNPKGYHMEDTMTTFSYIYMWLNLRYNRDASTKGICLMWSRGRHFPPSLPRRGQGIGTAISSWHKRSTGRNLVVHRHGTALRQRVQEVPLLAELFFFFSLFHPFFLKHAM